MGRIRKGLQPLVLAALVALWAPAAFAQETVAVSLPSSVVFMVVDVGSGTVSGTTTVSFQDAALLSGRSLLISVQSDSASFSLGGSGTIDASKVQWSASGAINGIGYSGTLSSSSYVPLFQSSASPSSGSVEIQWTLLAPGADGLRAGTHMLSLRWKLESVL
jgi:hypothetical protein